MTQSLGWRNEYRALVETAGVADVSDRAAIELTGADRAKFLHNLCSNDILRLAPGEGREAFLLNAKGKIIGHVFGYCGDDSLLLDAAPGQAEKLMAHLDRYIIREKVELRDVSERFGQWLIAGPNAQGTLEGLGVAAPREPLAHRTAEIAGDAVSVRHSGLLGANSWSVLCRAPRQEAVLQALEQAGAIRCGKEALEAARIEAGVPRYGVDITEENLPQEVDRNDQAISFTKGCYLGQETVARIDALGHVNRTLVGVRFVAETVPETGGELRSGEAVVGRITSAAYSPRLEAPVGLAYVRQGHNQPGARLTATTGEAEVTPLPMS